MTSVDVLIRKVGRARWERSQGLAADEIPADAVMDLRAEGNAVSFWKSCDSSPTEIRAIAVALATGFERPDKLDVAWIRHEHLQSRGVEIEPSHGRTPAPSLRDRHVDAVRLDARRMVEVAAVVADALRQEQHVRLTRVEVIELVVGAVQQGIVEIDALQPKLKDHVKGRLDPRSTT